MVSGSTKGVLTLPQAILLRAARKCYTDTSYSFTRLEDRTVTADPEVQSPDACPKLTSLTDIKTIWHKPTMGQCCPGGLERLCGRNRIDQRG